MRVICTAGSEPHSPGANCPAARAGQCDDCMYYTRISEPIEVEEDLPTAGELRWIGNAARARADAVEWHIAFLNMAAAFEELAGEHRGLQKLISEAAWVGDSVEKVAMPNPSEDQVSVRPYVRAKPRRSRTSPEARYEATPTTEIPPAGSESPASLQGQPEPFSDGVTLWYCEVCGKPTDIYPCRVCGGVPLSPESAELVRQGLEDAAEGRVSDAPPTRCDTCSHGFGSLTCLVCVDGSDYSAQPTCVETSVDSGKCMQSHTAVCRWEVGRWGI